MTKYEFELIYTVMHTEYPQGIRCYQDGELRAPYELDYNGIPLWTCNDRFATVSWDEWNDLFAIRVIYDEYCDKSLKRSKTYEYGLKYALEKMVKSTIKTLREDTDSIYEPHIDIVKFGFEI